MRAYIFINTKPGTSEEVVKRIKSKVKEVVQADSIYGRYDAIIIIEAPKLESINEILYRVIEKDPNIIHTETSLAL
ncbi:MAG: Lrp/AsnC ligand binding domain-containing protein [Candidatus Bathyarchaeia archaeon]